MRLRKTGVDRWQRVQGNRPHDLQLNDDQVKKAMNKSQNFSESTNDVPNFAFVVDYANSSWTLKADISSLFFAKLLNFMKAK